MRLPVLRAAANPGIACALLLFAAGAAWTVTATAATAAVHVLEVRVIAVADGDSLTARDSNGVEHGIRLAAIDAPEHDQPYSRQSKDALATMVLGRPVRIEWVERDAYGRLVARLWVITGDAPCQSPGCPKTLDAGLAQLISGLAWHYKKYQGTQSEEDRHRYADAESEARARRIGLWQQAGSVPPWDWRHGLTAGPIKKSRHGICHAPDSPNYGSVRKFTSYPSLEACVASGGRLPKPPGG